ncbi:hypothetical protein HQQ80_01145 [Microbacteriaceae bacterium VKM Ac-2855]|nr:hypothetical protein [Microbacteriaceae bacterium VKM Ac-2855]
MTDEQPPSPSFDPRRSDAIRTLLTERIADDTSPAARRRRHTRTAGLSVLAVLTGVAVSGTAAFALSGGTLFAAPAVVETATPTPTPTPTPSATSAPPVTTPVTPVNPPAPVVRVPLNCEQLIPAPDVVAILGGPAAPVADSPVYQIPTLYTDRRVGGMGCAWKLDESASAMSIRVVPGVTAETFVETRAESFAGATADPVGWIDAPSVGPEAIETCASSEEADYCNVRARGGDYGVEAYASTLTPAERTAFEFAIGELLAGLSNLPVPEPLWQPTGPTLRGASDCDAVIPTRRPTGDHRHRARERGRTVAARRRIRSAPSSEGPRLCARDPPSGGPTRTGRVPRRRKVSVSRSGGAGVRSAAAVA